MEEKFDFKEMSHNFESTMDDISDAELESLEQELDDLIAAAAIAVNSDDDEAVKSLEEKTVGDVEESLKEKETPKVIEECLEKTVEKVEDVQSEKNVEDKSKISLNASEDDLKPSEIIEESSEAILEPTQVPEASEEALKSPIEPTQELLTEEHPSVIENEPQESISEALEAEEPQQPQEPPQIDPDTDAAISVSSTDESASIQNLPSQSNDDFSINESVSTGSLTSQPLLGHVPPHWIPDSSSLACMQCDQKFTLVRRRHHCRACGLLLCSSCCSAKYFLHYLQSEGRICERCCVILKMQAEHQQQPVSHPSPTNPSSYCSTIPVQQQVNANQQPPTVMVPSGVLKRSGPRSASERKSVMFSDGIRPGTDLDETVGAVSTPRATPEKPKLNFPKINEKSNSYIPDAVNELPPILVKDCEFKYVDNNLTLLHRLRQEELKFAINKNFYVIVKIVTCELN
jgi:MAD (mothers against decapentaplegic) interacting protein